ncbi:hypothetical protein D187_005167 [Cystobacter fuscus DSM 2262]|uniref:Uncharacterized protein n=2 Tax=Cystobacter fuscus TaxID=43 RepID=S9QRY6_CYSF2|nr:hypothetical protein D187_005167 [Cystobacter fuscus DSM 2262]
MLGVLNSVIESYAEGSRERDATELAQLALLYIRNGGKVEDFARFRKDCVDTSFTVEVSHEFSTREEADAWLASGKAVHRERIKIAGKGFMVVQLPGRQTLIDRPLPEELRTAEWMDDSE